MRYANPIQMFATPEKQNRVPLLAWQHGKERDMKATGTVKWLRPRTQVPRYGRDDKAYLEYTVTGNFICPMGVL